MADFHYIAITPAGTTASGVIEAADEAEVVSQLRRQGNIPARIEPAGRHHVSALLSLEFGRGAALHRSDLTNITRELAVMLRAGQDIDRALRFLVETAPSKRVHQVVEQLRERVQSGSSLASALEQQPRSFPRLYVGLVRAGETSGTLPTILASLASLLERQRSLINEVQSAMIYPGLLLVTAAGSITLLLTRVIPQFVPLFEQNGVALPRLTQMLITGGNLVSRYGPYGLICTLVLVLIAGQVLRRPGPRLVVDRMILSLPLIGSLAREMLAAQFGRTLGTLLGGGMPLIGALEIVGTAVSNRAGAAGVRHAAESAATGAGLSKPLGRTGLFPVRLTHLLRLGEENGQLGEMALQAAAIHEENVRIGLERVVSLLVPAIVVVMGAAVALVVSSLLVAMLSLNALAH